MNNDKATAYVFHVLLLEVSPAIWRRLLVRSDSTVSDLHYAIQIALEWSDSHLHAFRIYGASYGVPKLGGISFSTSCEEPLSRFEFRKGERFLYEYDFTAHWRFQIRFEGTRRIRPNGHYPSCIGGKRWAPPEECGGPWQFMQRRERYGLVDVVSGLEKVLENPDAPALDACESLLETGRWLDLVPIRRQAINDRLKQHNLGEDVFAMVLG